MNVVLIVIDSLRAKSLQPGAVDRPVTPFLDWLSFDTPIIRPGMDRL